MSTPSIAVESDVDTSADDCATESSPARERTERAVAYGWEPRRALLGAALLTLALVVINAFAAGGHEDVLPAWLRTVLVFSGALLLPGIPLVVLLRIPSRSLAAALTFSLSLSTTILAAQGTMIIDHWDPLQTQWILLASSLVLTGAAYATLPARVAVGSTGLARARWTRQRAWQIAGLAVSVGALVWAGREIDVVDIGALGVLTAIGPVYLLGLLVLACVLVSAFRAHRIDPVVMCVSTLVVIAYNVMLVAVATGETSIPNSFVHRGFVTIIAETAHLPAQMDARFSWAGFFTGSAHLMTIAGMGDITSVLVWSPLVFGAMLSLGLYSIAINITGNARLAWLSVLAFQAVNWYQQDYYAPQAVALLGYVAVVATGLWQLRVSPLPVIERRGWRRPIAAARRVPGRVPGFGPGRTIAVGAALLAIITANTVSHQITPILMIFALFAFAVSGTTPYRTLWLAAGLVFAAWFVYGASDYWIGHLQSLLDEIGEVGNAVDAGVAQRLSGDPVYQRMQYLRMAASGFFVLLGIAGWLVCPRQRNRAKWVGAMLCAAPGCLLFLQSYGGEMILRAFLLSTPTIAPFAAIGLAVFWHRLRRRITSTRVLGGLAIAAILIVGVVETTNRGLNTAFEASTRAEVDITDEMMAALPPNTALMTFSHAPHTIGIRRNIDPTGPRVGYIDSYPCLDDLARCALDRSPNYVYITNQGVQMIALQYGRSLDAQRRDVRRILDSGQYLVDTDTASVVILRRTDSPHLDLPSVADAKNGNALL